MILTLTDTDCPIRIVSDVHIDYMYSYIRRARQLEPLFDGVRTLVFNGDTVEQRARHPRDWKKHIAEIREMGHKLGVRVIFITGNHDPHVSNTHALRIGHSVVHHGDLFTTPSGDGDPLPVNFSAALQQLHEHRTHRAKIDSPSHFWHYIPNLQFVWRAWMQAPQRAQRHFQQAQDPYRLLILGHTHFSGHWKFSQHQQLLNTGSMFPLGNSFVVDAANVHEFTLRRLHKQLLRRVRVGQPIVTITL